MQRYNLAKALSFCVFQNTSHREINLLSKQLYIKTRINYNKKRAAISSSYFFAKRVFRLPTSLEQLLLSNNYFLVTNTFCNPLILEEKYFSSQLLFRRKVFSRINNYSEYVLFLPNSSFFKRGTFSRSKYFLKWVALFL